MERFLKFFGGILIVLVLAISLVMAVPKVIGYGVFDVVSGSMEPAIHVGALVLVQPEKFEDIKVEDVIAFSSGGTVITHRVVEIDETNKMFVTKGDANENPDMNKVAYVNTIGVVKANIPFLGRVGAFISTSFGKIIAAALVIIGLGMNYMAEKLSSLPKKPDGPFTGGVKINRRKKIKAKKPVGLLIIGLLIIACAVCGGTMIVKDYMGSNELYDSIADNYVTQINSSDWSNMINVDFQSLKSSNPDIIGWIYVENTDISYPLMYSGDDETYLHTSFNKETSKAGSIFVEGGNNPDLTDSHTIVYGHNMKNGSMFGSLKKYKADNSYIDDGHKYFQIHMVDGTKYRYEIFSYFDTPADGWVYAIPYSPTEEFGEYISKLKSSSYVDLEVEVDKEDYVVTLSTCSKEDMRFVVNGVLVERVR